jgi:mandelamide amidase
VAGLNGDLCDLGLIQAARAIRDGEASAAAYCAALEARADETAGLNIFISRNPRLAEQAAEADARRARGEVLGPLAGVPLLVKDNIDTAELPTSAGTPGLRDWRPKHDAPVLRRLLDAGALVLGKANLQELALGITSNNRAFGPVRNPYDPAAIAGGSSGGTAAGIAARVGPAGLGSDTAGSIRIPAALCGVAGLRPTLGRWSQAGIVPLSSSRDTAGPMARSVADLALMDEIVTGEHEAGEAGEIRLGVPQQHFWDDLDAETEKVCRAALARAADAGARLVDVDVAAIVETAERIGRSLTLYECIRDLRAYLEAGGSPITAEEVIAAIASPDVAFGYGLAARGEVGAGAYDLARNVLQPRLRGLYGELFAAHGLDALVFPATPLPARPVGQDATVELNGRRADTRSTYLRNTEQGALAGIPGLVMPAGLTGAGLPLGLELDGPAGSDRRLLAMGAALEPALGPMPPPPCP